MILEFDLGNSCGKWRQLRAGAVMARGSLSYADLHRGLLPGESALARPRRVRAANVAGAQVAGVLQQVIGDKFGLPVEFARVEPDCAGVTCAYRDVGRLGVDRWLAVLAAHQRYPGPALVADCGSALTLDLLGAGGQHLGGYILPGLELMHRALFRDTDAVKVSLDPSPGMSLSPGRDTGEAVNRGLLLMALGAVERSLRLLESQSGGAGPRLWLTGGDAALISSFCEWPYQIVPDLVLDGLALTNP
ncbi:type III pantothenate kinase [Microbulbifer sp. 2201CG32-9]|uniref:type III pantothenate kinase n=1 Tax=Microbulbifer sp. 2201CG32-9 TaxID=3232309 RepID=UPI00345C4B0E